MNDPLNAEGRWYEILTFLGVPAHHLTGKHGPCPMCGGKDRFRWTNKHERGLYICSGCGNGNGITLLMKFKGWDKAGAGAAVGLITGTHKEKPPEGDPYRPCYVRHHRAHDGTMICSSTYAFYRALKSAIACSRLAA
jgi:hypothetical protein